MRATRDHNMLLRGLRFSGARDLAHVGFRVGLHAFGVVRLHDRVKTWTLAYRFAVPVSVMTGANPGEAIGLRSKCGRLLEGRRVVATQIGLGGRCVFFVLALVHSAEKISLSLLLNIIYSELIF